jgi:hypothetical protein
MRLSRVRKHKNKKMEFSFYINEGLGNQSSIKKLILSSALVGTALFSSSVAYADMGLSDYLKNWYLERLYDSETFLTSSIETETANQKASLLRQVREQTEQSVRELQEYAASKKSIIKQNIQDKAKETLEEIQTQNQLDVENVKNQIDEQAKTEQQEPAIETETDQQEHQGKIDDNATDSNPTTTNELSNDIKNIEQKSTSETQEPNALTEDENSVEKSNDSITKLGLE